MVWRVTHNPTPLPNTRLTWKYITDVYRNAKEQEAIALILKRRARGESLRDICGALEADGHKRKAGRATWHPQAVLRIINRERRAA